MKKIGLPLAAAAAAMLLVGCQCQVPQPAPAPVPVAQPAMSCKGMSSCKGATTKKHKKHCKTTNNQ